MISDSHNYCRQTDSITPPWCYTTDPATKFENCDVKLCWNTRNEIVATQATCGLTAAAQDQLKVSRIVGGRDADRDEIPFIANMRYKRTPKSGWHHRCGGTIISSQSLKQFDSEIFTKMETTTSKFWSKIKI